MSDKSYRLLVGGLLGLTALMGVGALLALSGKLRTASLRDPMVLQSPASPSEAESHGASGLAADSAASASGTESPSPPEAGAPEASRASPVGPQPLEQTGSGPGSTPSLELSPGLYRIAFRSDGSFGAVSPVVEEGLCGDYPFFIDEAGPFEGSATYRSIGCRVHFEVTATSASWTVSVDAVGESGALSLPATFTGSDPTITPLMDLPAGEYRLALRTDSPYSMVTPIVLTGGCIERPVFVLTGPGAYEMTYRSGGCQAIFQVSNVTANWEFSISPGG